MLVALLVLSVAFTAFCVAAGSRPPASIVQKPATTPVVVEMQEDNDLDEDPPTVVMAPRRETLDIVKLHRIETDPMAILLSSIKMGLLKISQFFYWV